jgi:hypothetical protein
VEVDKIITASAYQTAQLESGEQVEVIADPQVAHWQAGIAQTPVQTSGRISGYDGAVS